MTTLTASTLKRSFFSLLCLLVAFESIGQEVENNAQRFHIVLTTAGPAVETSNSAAPGFQPISMLAEADSTSVAATMLIAERLTAKAPRRMMPYSEDSIVFVGLADDASELTRTVKHDPRLIRAEAIRGENDLTSSRFYRKSVNVSVVMHHPDVETVRILKPVWGGTSWQFELLAEVSVK